MNVTDEQLPAVGPGKAEQLYDSAAVGGRQKNRRQAMAGVIVWSVLLLIGLGGCADDPGTDMVESPGTDQLFPDVVGVEAVQGDDGAWTFSVTLSSPYDSPERYADAWRVVGPDGTVFGERILTHDHANEQPFTRSQSGIVIPAEVIEVTVEGRDQVSGWGGAAMTITLDP
jgi:hypothetical protein